jgi:hypothetical protein
LEVGTGDCTTSAKTPAIRWIVFTVRLPVLGVRDCEREGEDGRDGNKEFEELHDCDEEFESAIEKSFRDLLYMN